MNWFNWLSLLSFVVAKNFIVQVNNSPREFINDENIIDVYIVGDLTFYLIDFPEFPIYLYSYDFVDYIEEDLTVSLFNQRQQHYFGRPVTPLQSWHLQTDPVWNLDRIDQMSGALNRKYYYYTSAGKNVNVYVIDTGIDIKHPEFEGRASWGINTVDKIDTDCNNHGTHVAGSIGSNKYGVAKKTNLIAVKILNCQGSGQYSGIIAGFEFVSKAHAKGTNPSVVNMSLGGGLSKVLNNAVAALIRQGIHVVAAAGNENQDACKTSPASETTVMTVGASGPRDLFATFSNWGTCVDILAPGVNIKSTTANNTYSTFQGTSMASPHVAGVYALILSDNKVFTPTLMKKLLTSKCTKNAIQGVKLGTPNCLLYSNS